MCVDCRRGAAVIAIAAYGGCLAVAALLSGLDGRARSILIVPLALAFFWGFALLIGSLCRVIFGERPEEWTRAGMLFVAVSSALVALCLLALESRADWAPLEYGLGFLAAAGSWVCLGALMGAIFGELPEIGMAEGD